MFPRFHLSLTQSLCCFSLFPAGPAPMVTPDTSRLISCILAASVSPWHTLPTSQDRASLVHLGHRLILEPVTVATRKWKRLIGRIWIIRPPLALGVRKRKSHLSTQTTCINLGQRMIDSPIIKQGIHLQEGELYWDGKTNNCSLTPVHLLG